MKEKNTKVELTEERVREIVREEILKDTKARAERLKEIDKILKGGVAR